jgi:hypothetical protein
MRTQATKADAHAEEHCEILWSAFFLVAVIASLHFLNQDDRQTDAKAQTLVLQTLWARK